MRSKFIMLLAILMGIVTTFLFYNYMQQFDAAAAINENTTAVVVAKEPIAKNTKLTTTMLKVVQVPEQGVHQNAVTTIEAAANLITTTKLETDEIILSHHIQQEKEESLFVSRKVAPNHRAVSIGINFVQSVSNLIEPEDEVDVIFSETIKTDAAPEVKTDIILHKKRVLAIGRKMLETKEGEEYVEYTSVTLELTADEAVKLVNASERGAIQLTLHTRVQPAGGDKEDGKPN